MRSTPSLSALLRISVPMLLGTTAAAQTSRDSAGIRIVENSRPLWSDANQWRVAATPTVDIGDATGDSLYELSNVRGVVQLRDGKIAVADGATLTVRLFDANGRFLRAFGRRGRGPGEFQEISRLTVMDGDTLVVLNSPGPLVSVAMFFNAAGQFIRQVNVSDGRRAVIEPSLAPDGSFIGWQLPVSRTNALTPRTGRWLDSLTLVRTSSVRYQVDTLHRSPYRMMGENRAFPAGASVLFSPEAPLQAVRDGYYLGFSDRFAFGFFTRDGALRRIVRRDVEPRALPRTAAASYRDWQVRRNPIPKAIQGAARQQLEANRTVFLKDLAFSEYLPAFREILVDRSAHVWVLRYEVQHAMPECTGYDCLPTYREPSVWDVFNPEGRWLGPVTLPANFSPLDIGTGNLIGIWRDRDDVEHVRVYRLERP